MLLNAHAGIRLVHEVLRSPKPAPEHQYSVQMHTQSSAAPAPASTGLTSSKTYLHSCPPCLSLLLPPRHMSSVLKGRVGELEVHKAALDREAHLQGKIMDMALALQQVGPRAAGDTHRALERRRLDRAQQGWRAL